MNGIGYVDRTWNPITGCTACSPGCVNCWARKDAHRLALNPKLPAETRTCYAGFRPHFWPDRVEAPRHWRQPQRVAVVFMGDLFHADWPNAAGLFRPPEWREIWHTMALCQHHTFLLLTKRPRSMQGFLNSCETLRNVWAGVSVCNQEEADEKIPVLLDTPAAVRWISIEPMLGPIDLERWLTLHQRPEEPATVQGRPRLDWVVLGGENGKGARPMHPGWAARVCEQCEMADVPFWFKGWGAWAPVRYWRAGEIYVKVGTDERKERVVGDGKSWPRCNVQKRGRPGLQDVLAGREWRQLPCFQEKALHQSPDLLRSRDTVQGVKGVA